jgi:hypothetical protein
MSRVILHEDIANFLELIRPSRQFVVVISQRNLASACFNLDEIFGHSFFVGVDVAQDLVNDSVCSCLGNFKASLIFLCKFFPCLRPEIFRNPVSMPLSVTAIRQRLRTMTYFFRGVAEERNGVLGVSGFGSGPATEGRRGTCGRKSGSVEEGRRPALGTTREYGGGGSIYSTNLPEVIRVDECVQSSTNVKSLRRM